MALSETLQLWVAYTQIIGSIAVAIGVLVGATTIVYNVLTAKKSLTSTFLYESRFDQKYIDGLHALTKIHNSGKSFRSYVVPPVGQPLNDEEKELRTHLVYCLNFYERLAVSVLNGIYHEDMVKQVFYSSLVKGYYTAEPFINAVREVNKKDTYYQELECLARKWKNKKLNSK